jgi:hypothetical protein
MQADRWFPQKGTAGVVGRVVEIEKPHPAKSREANRPINVMVPALQTKVLKDSSDVSFKELKPHNKDQILADYPGAWDHYLASKGGDVGKQAEVPQVNGTPIDKADFMPKEKLAGLKMIGFSTVEQLADMSDEQVQSLGPGARNWRKKAKTLLGK